MINNEEKRTVADKTSVPQNIAEKLFHIQYYFYLLTLMKEGEEVGMEIKDDCHIEYSNKGTSSLMQLKHSILLSSDDTPKNLQRKDKDLWHTISNWIDYISDPAEKRDNLSAQLFFIEKTDFSLITNKSIDENFFQKLLISFQGDEIEIEMIIEELSKIPNTEEKDKTEVDKYIQKLIDLPIDLLKIFLKKIQIIQYSFEDLRTKTIEQLSKRLLQDDFYIQNVYESFYSNLNEKIYKQAVAKKIILNKQKYEEELGKCVLKYSSKRKYLVISSDNSIPTEVIDNLLDQTFIKQLIDIKALDEEDDILELTEFRYAASNSLNRWEMDHLELDNAKAFKKERQTHFRNTFKKIYNNENVNKLNQASQEVKEELFISFAQACLSEIREKYLKYGGTILQLHICNGHFYWLSDIPEIGWRYDWKERFNAGKNGN